MAVLPDVLAPGLRVVFCGTAVGDTSKRVRAYYAGPGNQFWAVLANVGITQRQLAPADFRDLPNLGIGLTDLVKVRAGVDSSLGEADYDVDGFRARIERYAPRIVAFNGKRAARRFYGLSDRDAIEYGAQPDLVGKSAVQVLPSTSGSARKFWDTQPWRDLAEAIRAAE